MHLTDIIGMDSWWLAFGVVAGFAILSLISHERLREMRRLDVEKMIREQQEAREEAARQEALRQETASQADPVTVG